MGWLPVDNRVAESSFLWLVEALLAFWAFLLPREVPVVFLGFCADMLSLCSFKSVVWSLSIIILCLIVVWFYLKTFFMSLTWIIWVSLVPDGWTVSEGDASSSSWVEMMSSCLFLDSVSFYSFQGESPDFVPHDESDRIRDLSLDRLLLRLARLIRLKRQSAEMMGINFITKHLKFFLFTPIFVLRGNPFWQDTMPTFHFLHKYQIAAADISSLGQRALISFINHSPHGTALCFDS